MGLISMIFRRWDQRKAESTKHYKKRFSGRRQQIMKAILASNFLDPYEIARRTGTTHQIVRKTLATAYRDGELLERVKRKVETPAHLVKQKKCETVWCYRLKNGGCDIIQSGTFHTDKGVETAEQIAERLNPLTAIGRDLDEVGYACGTRQRTEHETDQTYREAVLERIGKIKTAESLKPFIPSSARDDLLTCK